MRLTSGDVGLDIERERNDWPMGIEVHESRVLVLIFQE